MKYTEVHGDLIKLTLEGEFDAIAHGCNCFCVMGAGIAPQMARAFGADKFPLEHPRYRGSINKLGMIDVGEYHLPTTKRVSIINAYTQYDTKPTYLGQALDYEALTLCFRKINKRFRGKKLGLPQIGCGLAGGSWSIVKKLIHAELIDVDVTVVIFNPLRDVSNTNS